MANITEELNNPQWVEGIYQLETTDPVLGGPNGIANRQAKELAARTQYLKKKQEEYKPGAASTTKAGIVQLSSATDSNSEELAATPKAVKAAYDKAVESAGKGLPVGAVIGFPRTITSQEGFLKADGSTFAQATYPDLHRVLGSNKLPNLTRSDIGMTAYFPVADI
ncbi:phage tail protein, partial [Eikenella halliae]|uniref:phage tail protein n=1 Tax=Eikenella halliae TaxID=1795832 RepID=UPI00362352CB